MFVPYAHVHWLWYQDPKLLEEYAWTAPLRNQAVTGLRTPVPLALVAVDVTLQKG